jgi:hypothetical protein
VRFKTRDYAHVTDRDLANEAEAERVAEAQILRSDAEREAASHRRPETDETAVYDLIHGGAFYAEDDPRRVRR